MSYTAKVVLYIGIAALALGAAGWLLAHNAKPDMSATDIGEADVRAAVTGFGAALQKVSVLSPTAADDMDAAYGPYVDAALLAQWKAAPSMAPGRQTSSPWPDHIDIDSVTKADDGTYDVTGSVVLMTSNEVEHGGNAGTVPVSMTLRWEGDSWKVFRYVEGAPAPAATEAKG